jgi:Mg-chelatase subunit ChlD
MSQRSTQLSNRDYTLIIDKSGSMSTPDQAGGKTRWQTVQESTLAIARKCEQLDPDGITVYLFAGRFRRFDNVTSDKVNQIFLENDPAGTTDLAGVLKDACDHYLARKQQGNARPETILVITDGEPDDRKAVMRVIVEASRQLDQDEELAISIIQVGNDGGATRFLKALDDELAGAGAKFDIVDTVTLEDMESMTLNEVLLNAIHD